MKLADDDRFAQASVHKDKSKIVSLISAHIAVANLGLISKSTAAKRVLPTDSLRPTADSQSTAPSVHAATLELARARGRLQTGDKFSVSDKSRWHYWFPVGTLHTFTCPVGAITVCYFLFVMRIIQATLQVCEAGLRFRSWWTIVHGCVPIARGTAGGCS